MYDFGVGLDSLIMNFGLWYRRFSSVCICSVVFVSLTLFEVGFETLMNIARVSLEARMQYIEILAAVLLRRCCGGLVSPVLLDRLHNSDARLRNWPR